MQVVIRAGMAGNGVPVLMAAGQSQELARPFGATWDGDRALWLYPAYFPAIKKVLADFKKLPIQIVFSEAAEKHLAWLKDVEARYEQHRLPDGFDFVTSPYQHQIEGLCHAYYMLRAALFYAPGLGKSKIAIDLVRLLHYLKQKDPVVIMGPLVTVRNWGKEIDRHSGGQLRWGAVLGTKKKKMEVISQAGQGAFDILLVTYDTAARHVDQIFNEVPYKTIVLDESHLVKEWASGRTKAAHEIGQKAPRKVIMTGTPTLGNPLDLYGQYKFLADYFMPEGYFAYKLKFLETSPYNKHVVTGYKNLDILNGRTKFVALRKTKEECLDLPDQTFVDVEYRLTATQVALYNQLAADLMIDVELLLRQLAGTAHGVLPPAAQMPHAAAMLNKLLQVCSGFVITNNMNTKLCDVVKQGGCEHLATCVKANIKPYTALCKIEPAKIEDTVTVFDDNPKLEALQGILDEVLADPSAKVIVWCYYRPELDIVSKALDAQGIKHVRVDGSTGDRIQKIADAFNDDPTIKVYLGQVSTGVGITLNSAAYMVYYSLPYSLGSYLQSLDRNYRIGQKKNVTVYKLLGRHTIEGAIASLLRNKVDVDQVLTHRLSCVVCPHSIPCIARNIKIFDSACIYQRNMVRPVTKAGLIKFEGNAA